MNRLVSLRLRKLPQVVWHHSDEDVNLQPDQEVLVQTQAGKEIATFLRTANDGEEHPSDPLVIKILRPVNADDRAFRDEIRALETQAYKSCRQKVESLKLNMRLLKAEYTYDKTRLIFYFKAEQKVDFRDLLKQLANQFRPARIELKQIGVRDEAKLLGAIGCCGKMVCCRQFLLDFHPVTTKMAKDQNMSLNPAKLSGICGRLLCCLSYEHPFYAEFQGKYPRLGAEIRLLDGPARVLDLNYLTQKIFVSYIDRRKAIVPLSEVKGRKCPVTGRNLWWVIDPERPDWEPEFPPPPVSKKKAGKPAGEGGPSGQPGGGQAGPRDGGPRDGGPRDSGPRDGASRERGGDRHDAQRGPGQDSRPGAPAGQASGDGRPRRDRNRERNRDRDRDRPRPQGPGGPVIPPADGATPAPQPNGATVPQDAPVIPDRNPGDTPRNSNPDIAIHQQHTPTPSAPAGSPDQAPPDPDKND